MTLGNYTKANCKDCEHFRWIVYKKGCLCQICNEKRLREKRVAKHKSITKGVKKAQKSLKRILEGKKKKRKAPSDKSLDTWFQKYVRLRDSDENGIGTCISCNQTIRIIDVNGAKTGELQAGHFQGRSKMATRWHQLNTNSQCPGCNGRGKGKPFETGRGIDNKYGAGTAEALWQSAQNGKKPMKHERIELYDFYKEKVKELLKDKNFEI